MLRINDIKLGLDENEDRLKDKILDRLRIKENGLISYRICRKSIDARKDQVRFVYAVDVEVHNEAWLLTRYSSRGVSVPPDNSYLYVTPGTERLDHPPVVIGTGPSGLFAGLVLARMGYRPILLERGEDVDSRVATVRRFWEGQSFDPGSNVQFGEGGAGTFSDGKLTTLIKDRCCRCVLEEMVAAGAPEEILYLNKPHVGSDHLKAMVRNLRQTIIDLGGSVRFHCQVTDLEIRDGRLAALIINGSEQLDCKQALLAIGHSARDTMALLHERGVVMSQKPFSIGLRVEHPQVLIDTAQYGQFTGHEKLPVADYKLAFHATGGRSAYTFCNCPGGYVIAAASEEGGVVTNGMSLFERSGTNANSALLVGVGPADYASDHPLAGLELQRRYEQLAFQLGGGHYYAPVQLVGDFLADRPSRGFGQVQPTYRPGVNMAELKDCLPGYVTDTLRAAIPYFATRINGFDLPEAVLTGVETRSSSPVRINRDDHYHSSVDGLYPVGEGAGYAGGIISSAVDGIKGAEQLAQRCALGR